MAKLNINGSIRDVEVEADTPLLWVIREQVGLTGTKYGCGEGLCGACTVVVDGEAVRSCQLPVKAVRGKDVLTIEGLAVNEQLHPLQKAFIEHGAVQCGFCTPGMILRGYSLLLKNPKPSRAQVVEYMEPSLCRCGTYSRVVDAVQSAAGELKGGKA